MRKKHEAEEKNEKEAAEKNMDSKLASLKVEDLTEDQKDTYQSLLPDLQKGYLEFLAKEKMKKPAPAPKENPPEPYTPEYGQKNFKEVQDRVTELLPLLKEKGSTIADILKITTTVQDKPQELPKEVWTRVDAIFDTVPNSAALKQWNREQVAKGRYAHIVSYLVQDFRNSAEAGELNALYLQLSKEGRSTLEETVKAGIGNTFAYELMCATGVKPDVFPPMLSPAYRTEIVKPAYLKFAYMRTYNANGKSAYIGVDKASPGGWEGNMTYIYDQRGKDVFRGEYFQNTQPSFFFNRYDSEGKSAGYHFFKTYLGSKGMFFLYEDRRENNGEYVDSKVEYGDLSEQQIFALRKFFRWERGEKNDPIFNKFKMRWELGKYWNAIDKMIRGMTLLAKKEGEIISDPRIQKLVQEYMDYVQTIPQAEQEQEIKWFTESSFKDASGDKFQFIQDGAFRLSLQVIEKK